MSDQTIIKKGFNAGYLLQKHRPEMAATLARAFAVRTDVYAEAFIAGATQGKQDMMRDQKKEAPKQRGKNFDISKMRPTGHTPSKEKGKDKSLDKDEK